ncbi:MAG: hypothetical protein LBI68_03410 [Azoarcus sp.]|jgi:hypothetical protein|nr:hypothetical protein [Azoarcus sp.]
MEMTELIIAVISTLIAFTIIVYATFLLIKRLHNGKNKFYSIKEWFKHILEALWGI